MSSSRRFIDTLEPRQLMSRHVGTADPADKANLTATEVETILGQAASQASAGQVIVVMDTEGVTLGIVGMKGFDDNVAPNGERFVANTGVFSEKLSLIRTA